MRPRRLGLIGAATLAAALAIGAIPVAAKPMHFVVNKRYVQPPTTSQCLASAHLACYSPLQLERAYSMGGLYNRGLTGAGETIVLVDSFGSPTIEADLKTFDADFGLPNPPSFRIIRPVGPIPKFDPGNGTMVSWGVETSLDVEYSHAMAPGANILLVETPVAETEGVQGLPQMMAAENYVIDHNLGDVISQSFGATEQTFPNPGDLLRLRSAFENAAAHSVTVLASSGDTGATNYELNGVDLFAHHAVGWPASDPLVTAVGGTQLHLLDSGKRFAPDNVWNDQETLHAVAAGSGGVSSVFSRPSFQDGVASVVGDHRGIPDVSLSAAVNGGALVYLGFLSSPGYYIVGGTSEASPLFAGIVAVADQAAGHRLGLLGPSLYALAAKGAPGIVDITLGNNSVAFTQNGRAIFVHGFDASPGYDLASGLGTPNGEFLVPELAGM